MPTFFVPVGPNFESKLRLRYAERVILQEMEMMSGAGWDGDASTIKTDRDDGHSMSASSKYRPPPNKSLRRPSEREGDASCLQTLSLLRIADGSYRS